MWIDDDDKNKLYIYSGSQWVVAQDTTFDQETLITTTANNLSLDIFTNSDGKIVRTPSPSSAGLFLGDTNLGYYNGSCLLYTSDAADE